MFGGQDQVTPLAFRACIMFRYTTCIVATSSARDAWLTTPRQSVEAGEKLSSVPYAVTWTIHGQSR